MRTEGLAHRDSNPRETLGWDGGRKPPPEGVGAGLAALLPLGVGVGEDQSAVPPERLAPVAVAVRQHLGAHARVAAWSGYACMRTEVLAHSDSNRSESLGWYGGLILAAEGLGAALAALVPLWIVLG